MSDHATVFLLAVLVGALLGPGLGPLLTEVGGWILYHGSMLLRYGPRWLSPSFRAAKEAEILKQMDDELRQIYVGPVASRDVTDHR